MYSACLDSLARGGGGESNVVDDAFIVGEVETLRRRTRWVSRPRLEALRELMRVSRRAGLLRKEEALAWSGGAGTFQGMSVAGGHTFVGPCGPFRPLHCMSGLVLLEPEWWRNRRDFWRRVGHGSNLEAAAVAVLAQRGGEGVVDVRVHRSEVLRQRINERLPRRNCELCHLQARGVWGEWCWMVAMIVTMKVDGG